MHRVHDALDSTLPQRNGASGQPNSHSTNPVWVDVRDAANRARVSAATIMREARSGRLRGYKIGGRKVWRFRPADIDAWVEGSSTPTPFPRLEPRS
jgi:excisionase family DNA binding protein